MLQDAILQCETSTKFTREARPRRVGPKRRGRAHESRSRFVDMNDQWTFQCEIQKRHPLRDETSTDETTPKPDRPRPHLGRNRVLAYGPVTFPHSGVSRMSASVRLMIQGHSARRASSRVRQCHQLIKISEIKSVDRRVDVPERAEHAEDLLAQRLLRRIVHDRRRVALDLVDAQEDWLHNTDGEKLSDDYARDLHSCFAWEAMNRH